MSSLFTSPQLTMMMQTRPPVRLRSSPRIAACSSFHSSDSPRPDSVSHFATVCLYSGFSSFVVCSLSSFLLLSLSSCAGASACFACIAFLESISVSSIDIASTAHIEPSSFPSSAPSAASSLPSLVASPVAPPGFLASGIAVVIWEECFQHLALALFQIFGASSSPIISRQEQQLGASFAALLARVHQHLPLPVTALASSLDHADRLLKYLSLALNAVAVASSASGSAGSQSAGSPSASSSSSSSPWPLTRGWFK